MAKKHRSAQDVYNDTSFVFREYGPFMKQFPSVKTIVVNYEEVMGLDTFFPAPRKKHTLSDNQLREYLGCSNARCHKGGANIGEIIRKMVRTKIEKDSGHLACAGDEYPEGGRQCLHSFDYSILIDYID